MSTFPSLRVSRSPPSRSSEVARGFRLGSHRSWIDVGISGIGTEHRRVRDAAPADPLTLADEQHALQRGIIRAGHFEQTGEVTLPVLAAFHAGDAEEQAFWRRTIEESEQTEDDLARALRLVEERGAIRATLDRAAGFADEAKQALAIFPDSVLRQGLMAVADFTVSRVR